MDLLEYQGKQLYRRHGIPTTPEGAIATTPAEAEQAARDAGGPVVVKAQVLTGGRGKAGGVKLASDPAEARQAAERILGLDIKGHTVEQVLVEPASDIAEEYYLSVHSVPSGPVTVHLPQKADHRVAAQGVVVVAQPFLVVQGHDDDPSRLAVTPPQ